MKFVKTLITVVVLLTTLNVKAQSQEMKREYGFNISEFFNAILSSETKFSSSGNKYKHTGFGLNLDGYRNYGQYEIGGSLLYSNYKTDQNESNQVFYELGIHFDYNFVVNQVGERMIPFTQVGLYTRKTDDKVDDKQYSSTPLELFAGVKYFLFNESVAVIGGLKYRTQDVQVENGGDYKFNDLSAKGLVVVYF